MLTVKTQVAGETAKLSLNGRFDPLAAYPGAYEAVGPEVRGLAQQVSGLTTAQRRTDERLDQLVHAQKEAANQIADLAKAQTKLAHEVGALGNSVGLCPVLPRDGLRP